jgi:hypothetical protein
LLLGALLGLVSMSSIWLFVGYSKMPVSERPPLLSAWYSLRVLDNPKDTGLSVEVHRFDNRLQSLNGEERRDQHYKSSWQWKFLIVVAALSLGLLGLIGGLASDLHWARWVVAMLLVVTVFVEDALLYWVLFLGSTMNGLPPAHNFLLQIARTQAGNAFAAFSSSGWMIWGHWDVKAMVELGILQLLMTLGWGIGLSVIRMYPTRRGY